MGCTPKQAQEETVSLSCGLRFSRAFGPLSDVSTSRTEPSAAWSQGLKARRLPKQGGAKIPRPRHSPLSELLLRGSVLLPAARPPVGGTSKFSSVPVEESRARSAPRPPTPEGPAAGLGDRRGAASHPTIAVPFGSGGGSGSHSCPQSPLGSRGGLRLFLFGFSSALFAGFRFRLSPC